MPAFYIVLQEDIPGVEAVGLDGRALSQHNKTLEGLAEVAGVTPLAAFFSADPKELAGLLDDQGPEQGAKIPEERWFTAGEGLETIAVLLASLSKVPVTERSALAKELADFQKVLNAALSHNIRWRLGIDY